MKTPSVLRVFAAILPLICCAQTRDWKKYPAVVEVDTTETVYAVGDAHADYARFTGVLASAKIIAGAPAKPDQVVWTAGKSVLVITGDMVDKGKDSLQVVNLVRALQSAAAAKGGRVIVTMGNHEGEFLADPKGSKTQEFRDALQAAGIKPKDVANCQGDIGQFLCNLPMGARVNDWFFSHAGNTDGRKIKAINSDIQAGFEKKGFATKELIGDNSILEARLNDKGPGGLPWLYNGDKKTDPQKLLADYAAALGVKHIVQGHQPGNVKFLDGKQRNAEDLYQRYGLIFLIDGGMSQGIDGSTSTGGALLITTRNVTAICASGKTLVLWDAKADPASNAIHCSK